MARLLLGADPKAAAMEDILCQTLLALAASCGHLATACCLVEEAPSAAA
jgi:hypothetical protein